MPSYNPKAIEPRWQRFWEENKTFRTPDTVRQAEVLHPRHVSLPQRGRPARRPSRRLHRHRHPGPLPADARLQRPAPDGLGRLRPARRAVRHRDRHAPARHHAEEHRHLPPADPDARLQLRLGPRGRYHRSELLQVDAVDLPAAVRHLVRRRAEEGPAHRRTADPGRGADAGRRPRCAPIGTANGWPIRPRCRSTGARPWARCWPTKKSIDGKSERGGHPVVRMPLRQWMLRITAYAERLLDDLELVDWSEVDQGDAAQLDRHAAKGRRSISRWPARARSEETHPRLHHPPRHALRRDLHGAVARASAGRCASPRRSSEPPCRRTRPRPPRKSDLERTELAKKKTGVFTGAYAINPVNNEKIPIWIADYVLASYGTGAIMAVPAHDERDFEFAKQFGLPIRTVVRPPDEWLKKTGSTLDNLTEAYIDEGVADQLRPVRRPADAGVQDRRSSPGWRNAAWARRRSTTSCATGCSAGSATGASRSRSCTSSTPRASRPA